MTECVFLFILSSLSSLNTYFVFMHFLEHKKLVDIVSDELTSFSQRSPDVEVFDVGGPACHFGKHSKHTAEEMNQRTG